MARNKSVPDIITQEMDAAWDDMPTRREPAPSRPARNRSGSGSNKPGKTPWWTQLRFWAGWVFAVVAMLTIVLGLLEFEQFLRHDTRFRLVSPVEIGEDSSSLQIEGVIYTARRDISKLFERDFGRSLYNVPVAERHDELKQLDWVKDVTVTRIWPNTVNVKIIERQPVAFVALVGVDSLTTTALIDREGVILRLPEQAKFSLPVITGIKRQERIELRREKVARALQMLSESGAAAEKISEVDVSELKNVKATMQMNEHAVTVMLGNSDYQRRLETFLQNYEEMHRSMPNTTKFDARVRNRLVTLPE